MYISTHRAHLYMRMNRFQDVALGQTLSFQKNFCKFFTMASILMHMITFCPEVSYNLVSYKTPPESRVNIQNFLGKHACLHTPLEGYALHNQSA